MPFGVVARVGQRNDVLDDGPDTPRKGQIFRKIGRGNIIHKEYAASAVQKRLNRPSCSSNWTISGMIPRNCVLGGRAYWRHLADTVK